MPLGNLTSQFFANIYLNELDYYAKYNLGVEYYIRYVDDFVILHSSKEQLQIWKKQIDEFLRDKLRIELHPQKSRIISLSNGIDFVGFRNFYYYRLVRERNIRKMKKRIAKMKDCEISYVDSASLKPHPLGCGRHFDHPKIEHQSNHTPQKPFMDF